jgi:hypothetical protein
LGFLVCKYTIWQPWKKVEDRKKKRARGKKSFAGFKSAKKSFSESPDWAEGAREKMAHRRKHGQREQGDLTSL